MDMDLGENKEINENTDINNMSNEYMHELIYQYIKKNIENISNCSHCFELSDFKFEDLNITIRFNIKPKINKQKNDSLTIGCFLPDYEEIDVFKHVFWHSFEDCNPKTITNFLFAFRTCYSYSKILDQIVDKKDIEKEEKTAVALIKFCKQEKIEKCCVCYDFNTVKTVCNHNLCRTCFQNIKIIINEEEDFKYKECPMCRHYLIF